MALVKGMLFKSPLVWRVHWMLSANFLQGVVLKFGRNFQTGRHRYVSTPSSRNIPRESYKCAAAGNVVSWQLWWYSFSTREMTKNTCGKLTKIPDDDNTFCQAVHYFMNPSVYAWVIFWLIHCLWLNKFMPCYVNGPKRIDCCRLIFTCSMETTIISMYIIELREVIFGARWRFGRPKNYGLRVMGCCGYKGYGV